MRTWIVVAAAVVVLVIVLALPTRSQETTRIGAVLDVTALVRKLDELKPAIAELKQLRKQSEELKKTVEEGNKTLEMIAAGVGVMRMPIRWEYNFIRSRSPKLANREGSQGWELVSIYKDDWFIFRRPLPPRKRDEANE